MTVRTRAASSQTPPGGINLSRERHHVHITSTTALLRRFPVVLRFCSCFWTIAQLGFRMRSRSKPCCDSRRQYFVNPPGQFRPATNTNGCEGLLHVQKRDFRQISIRDPRRIVLSV